MQLHKIEATQEGCMITYDSLSGYVDNSISTKLFPNNLEGFLRSLSLNNSQDLLYEDLLAFLSAQFLFKECRQPVLSHFKECYSKSVIQHCHKIGEGLYGEVFLFRNQHGGTTVMKVIPIEGNQTVNGECQKKIKEVYSEISIASALSNLRYNRINQTSTFIEVQGIQCVQGRYPEDLLELWKLYKETRGSINESPEIFQENQLFAIIETTYGGTDMESFTFDNAAQVYSMFLQIVYALAVAEEELQFEHRDLHWGNILLSCVPMDEKISFILKGREIKVASCGVKVAIIDFTMSRITLNKVDIYDDLGKDCGIFNGSGDYQFEIYQLMQKKNGNEWSHFEPYSNVLWLSYILDKAITSLRYKNPRCKLHKKYMNKLKELHLEILGYDSTNEFVVNLCSNKFF